MRRKAQCDPACARLSQKPQARQSGHKLSQDIALLQRLGLSLDAKIPGKRLGDLARCESVRDFLIASLLRIRNKKRGLVRLIPNRAQREFAGTCTHRNIVLKARQMGITTYIAARFLVQTITRPGTMTVQVAHDQESAEEIFKIVHRFWENLPDAMKRGALITLARQRPPDGVPAARQRVPRGHGGGRQRRPRADHPQFALLGGRPLAARCRWRRWRRCGRRCRPMGRSFWSRRRMAPAEFSMKSGSTRSETGYTRHFFPWWYDDEYRDKVGIGQSSIR